MGKLWQDIRYGARMLVKNPGVSTIAIISLALGIGANTTIFTVVNAVLLNPLPVKDISRVVEVDTIDSHTHVTTASQIKMGMSYPNCRDYARDNQVFTGLACYMQMPLTWSGRGEAKQVAGQLVSANYFDVLGLRPATGRFFFPDEDTKPSGNTVAVISYSFWADKFGSDPGLIGRTLTFNATPYTIIGVAPRGFRGPFTFADPDQVWIPASMYPQVLTGFVREWFNDRRALLAQSFARLKPGISIGAADASLKTIATHLEGEYPKDNAGRSVTLTPMAQAAVGANEHDQFALAGGVMMGIVGLVLLIACVNLANLLLAQSARREKEMSLRAALGAGRGRILRQLVTESMLLALVGGAVGFVVAYWGRTALWSFRPSFIQDGEISLALDWRVLLFTLAISVFTGVLFGIAPAIKSSRPDLVETLKIGGRGNTVGWRSNPLRSLLVVSEIALAMVALIGAGLFVRSMQNAQNMSLGFESRKLFVMAFDLGALHYDEGRGDQFFRQAIDRAKATPGVADATIASNLPLGGGFERTTFPEGQDVDTGYRGTLTELNDVMPNYFETLHIPVIAGRAFTDSDRAMTTPVAVVNEAMAKHFWPNENALGKRFHFIDEPKLREIVGIVPNTIVNNIGEDPQPLIYLPITQEFSPFASMEVRTVGDPQSVVSSVRAQVQSLDPNLAITNVQTIGEVVDQGLWAPRMGAALLGLFGGLALILAAVGVYGVLSYSVTQQTHEIGIRMALGAQPLGVLKLVVGQGLKLAAAGLVVGLIGALVATRVLSSLLFNVSTHDPVTFIGVSLVLVATAALACYIPARRATRVDPIIALRYE
jgi:putative ABC transport system permease protein